MKILIGLENGTVTTDFDAPVKFDDYLVAMFTSILATANTCVASETDPRDQDQARKDIYDLINNAASNTLTKFAPDLELRPTLTEAAILRAENEIMQEVLYAKEMQAEAPPEAMTAPETETTDITALL